MLYEFRRKELYSATESNNHIIKLNHKDYDARRYIYSEIDIRFLSFSKFDLSKST